MDHTTVLSRSKQKKKFPNGYVEDCPIQINPSNIPIKYDINAWESAKSNNKHKIQNSNSTTLISSALKQCSSTDNEKISYILNKNVKSKQKDKKWNDENKTINEDTDKKDCNKCKGNTKIGNKFNSNNKHNNLKSNDKHNNIKSNIKSNNKHDNTKSNDNINNNINNNNINNNEHREFIDNINNNYKNNINSELSDIDTKQNNDIKQKDGVALILTTKNDVKLTSETSYEIKFNIGMVEGNGITVNDAGNKILFTSDGSYIFQVYGEAIAFSDITAKLVFYNESFVGETKIFSELNIPKDNNILILRGLSTLLPIENGQTISLRLEPTPDETVILKETRLIIHKAV